MPAEFFALGAAFGFASARIAVKFATQTGTMVVGFLTSLTISVVAVGLLAAVTVDSWTVPMGATVLFTFAGLAGPGMGRILGMRAVRDAGTSVAVPIQSSIPPLAASAAGPILFAETVGLDRLLPIALILSGVWLCARGGSANRQRVLSPHLVEEVASVRHWVLLIPLSAGAAYGAADIVMKFALVQHNDAVIGAFIGLVAAYVVWLTIFLTKFRQPIRITRSLGWFCLSGLLGACGYIALVFALHIGDLSVVAPIVAAEPVIVITLGALLLRDLETLRTGTILGAAIVFLGVAYLAMA